MITFTRIHHQIETLTSDLIELGFSDRQNYPSIRYFSSNCVEISYKHQNHLTVAYRNIPYKEIYNILNKHDAYNIMMPDGALIQFMYRFIQGRISQHRLAFYPSPYLEEYQNNPEIYEIDELFAEVIKRDIVPFPFRFDFDSSELQGHPKSHLTIGHYKNCRIPVSSPLTPYHFLDFILRNFYNTAFINRDIKLTQFRDCFDQTIILSERRILHIEIPNIIYQASFGTVD